MAKGVVFFDIHVFSWRRVFTSSFWTERKSCVLKRALSMMCLKSTIVGLWLCYKIGMCACKSSSKPVVHFPIDEMSQEPCEGYYENC
jgi:hypothetical protein